MAFSASFQYYKAYFSIFKTQMYLIKANYSKEILECPQMEPTPMPSVALAKRKINKRKPHRDLLICKFHVCLKDTQEKGVTQRDDF